MGIVRPMLSYGALVWAHETKPFITKLTRLNRLAINPFCSIPRSVPTGFLEIMLNVQPLHLFVKREALKSYFRLR